MNCIKGEMLKESAIFSANYYPPQSFWISNENQVWELVKPDLQVIPWIDFQSKEIYLGLIYDSHIDMPMTIIQEVPFCLF